MLTIITMKKHAMWIDKYYVDNDNNAYMHI